MPQGNIKNPQTDLRVSNKSENQNRDTENPRSSKSHSNSASRRGK